MKRIFFVIVLSIFVSACGSNQPAPPPPPAPAPAPGPGVPGGVGKWTQQQFEGEKQYCIQGSSGYGDFRDSFVLAQSVSTSTSGSAGVTQFCQCVYAAVSQRYTFQEYQTNIRQIRSSLCQDQTISNCEKSANLPVGGTCDYYGY